MTRPILALVVAITVTTTMDAKGLSVFSALPLLPLGLALWWWERFPRKRVGLSWGTRYGYIAAVLHPVVVLGLAAIVAALAGAVDVSAADWGKAALNIVLGGVSTILVAILTEEGFFRGCLWASLRRAGQGERATLLWTSAAFSLWHLSAVTLETGFDLPAGQVPVFMINALALGFIWGWLRMRSGSIIVASVAHGLWNGLDYALFGFGDRIGALGIQNTAVFGPESGFVGVVFNVLFAATLAWLGRRHGASETNQPS